MAAASAFTSAEDLFGSFLNKGKLGGKFEYDNELGKTRCIGNHVLGPAIDDIQLTVNLV